jgi:hypothetical protein
MAEAHVVGYLELDGRSMLKSGAGIYLELLSMRLLSSIHPSKRVAYVREDASGIYGRSILYMAAQASGICEHKHLSISFFLSFLPRNFRV